MWSQLPAAGARGRTRPAGFRSGEPLRLRRGSRRVSEFMRFQGLPIAAGRSAQPSPTGRFPYQSGGPVEHALGSLSSSQPAARSRRSRARSAARRRNGPENKKKRRRSTTRAATSPRKSEQRPPSVQRSAALRAAPRPFGSNCSAQSQPGSAARDPARRRATAKEERPARLGQRWGSAPPTAAAALRRSRSCESPRTRC